jgi:hypothetical protein
LIDTFEQLEHLTTFLFQELLPRLETGVRVVIAGRRPLVLAWSRAEPWPKIVRLLPLAGFTAAESRAYLAQRGIDRRELKDQVVSATAGNPLALSLAADIIAQFGVRDFAADPHWHLAARSLAKRLLSETADDPEVLAAVEAASVVRVFDEATLSAVTGQEDVSRAFDRLCRLSIIKPEPHGLMLDDHVREIIVKDLRWRRPDRYQLLRKRALEYFKLRLRTSSQKERGWLIGECFFLWENPIIREVFFGPDTLGSIAVEPATSVDPETVIDLYSQGPHDASQFNADAALFSEVIGFAHTRIRVARNDDGNPVGFSMVLPLCKESIAFLERHPVHADLVNAYFVPAKRQVLVAGAEDATDFYILPIVAATEERGAALCALFRELAGIFGLNGVYLCMSREPWMDRLLTDCAFDMLTESHQSGRAVKGWALDLKGVGFGGWIQAVIDGRHVEARPSNGDLQTEILSALIHWDDAAWLAVNCHLLSDGVALTERAEMIRQTIQEAFSHARAEGPGSMDKALRALELAYLKRSASHKQAMRSLSVSRATFYRLCKRGVGTLAEHVASTPRRRSTPETLRRG